MAWWPLSQLFFKEKKNCNLFRNQSFWWQRQKNIIFVWWDLTDRWKPTNSAVYNIYFYLFLLFELQLLFECLCLFPKMDIFLISLCLCHRNWPNQRHKLKQHNKKWYYVIMDKVWYRHWTSDKLFCDILMTTTRYWLLATVELFRLHILEYNRSFRSGTAKRKQC